MYIAMNRFKVANSTTQQFEDLWHNRESYLHELDGFVEFHLLRGPEQDDHVLYASHTIWRTRDDFIAWTKSEQFRKTHASAGSDKIRPLYVGHPEFEGFDVVQEVKSDGSKRSLSVDTSS